MSMKIPVLVEKLTTLNEMPYIRGGTFGRPSQVEISLEVDADFTPTKAAGALSAQTKLSFSPRFGRDAALSDADPGYSAEKQLKETMFTLRFNSNDKVNAALPGSLFLRVEVVVKSASTGYGSRNFMFGEQPISLAAGQVDEEVDIVLHNDEGPCALLHVTVNPAPAAKSVSSFFSGGMSMFGFGASNKTPSRKLSSVRSESVSSSRSRRSSDGRKKSRKSKRKSSSINAGDFKEIENLTADLMLDGKKIDMGKLMDRPALRGVFKAMNDAEEYLDKGLAFIPFFDQLEEHLGIRKISVLLTIVAVVAVAVLASNSGHITRFISQVLSIVYPGWVSFRAIESKDKDDDAWWLSYWLANGLIMTVEQSIVELMFEAGADETLFYMFKIIIVAWLVFPEGRGQRIIYEEVMRPWFIKNDELLDGILVKPFAIVSGARPINAPKPVKTKHSTKSFFQNSKSGRKLRMSRSNK